MKLAAVVTKDYIPTDEDIKKWNRQAAELLEVSQSDYNFSYVYDEVNHRVFRYNLKYSKK